MTSAAGHGSNAPPDSLSAAKEILTEALKICLKTDFPELMAIVRLLLARIAVRINLYDEADFHLHEFGRIKVQDHVWIRRLYRKVFSEYHREEYLVLQDEELHQDAATRALKRHLIARAEAKAKREKRKVTDEVMAEILGVSRQTVLNWRHLPGK